MKSELFCAFATTLRLLLFLCSCNLGVCDPDSNNIDPNLQSLIDEYIETKILPTYKVPGLSLSIIRNNGDILYSTGYGYKNLEEQQKTDNKTLFGIGSVSKSFTATVIVKALSEKFPQYGSKVLDIPIQKLLSISTNHNFTLRDRYRSESATFRDLLSHNTCLDPQMLGIYIGAFQSQKELVYRQRYAKEECSFRTDFVYNNNIIAMAGEYIGLIMNTTFAELLKSLLSDLDMIDTTFVTSKVHPWVAMTFGKGYFLDFFVGYRLKSDWMYYYKDNEYHLFNPEVMRTVSVCPGAGGILSSSSDMLKYLKFHLSYGQIGDKVIIPENVMRWLHVPANFYRQEISNVDLSKPMLNSYGLGFELGIKNKYPTSSHGGKISTFSSLLSLHPTLNLGIYSSSNGRGVMGDHHGILHDKIFEIIIGGTEFNTIEATNATTEQNMEIQTTEQIQATETTFDQTEIKSTVILRGIDEIIGQYGNGYAGEFDIIFKNGTGMNQTGLYLNYGSLGTGFLRESDVANIYYLELDSDLIQEAYADGLDTFEVKINFNIPEKATLNTPGGTVEFDKGMTLDKLPVIPYDPQSCLSIN